MTSTKDKDKAKQLQDKCQSVLNSLLRDEDNKYCVDCDSKGPRWASWNIGVFLCIRCAGIHRNLGVHISKVKSVNLDAWTPEQVVSLQQMGNSRARAVYEANLPDNFRRPQNDSGLESFVRAKYEHKKYIAREWVPPVLPKVNWEKEIDDDIEKQKRKKKTALSGDKSGNSSTSKNKLAAVSNNDVVPQLPKPKNPSPKPAHHSASCRAKNARKDDSSSNNKSSSSDLLNDSTTNKQKQSSDSDLLNLATTPQQNGATTTTSEDGFSNFLSATPAQNSDSCQQSTDDTTATTAIQSEEESFFNQTIPAEKEKVKLTKDSILALYKNVAAPSAGGQFQTNFQQQISYAPLNGLTTNQSQQAPSFGSLQWTPSNSCQSFQQQQQQSAMQFPVMHQLQQQQQMAAAQFPTGASNFAQFPHHQAGFQHGAVLTTNMAAALPGQPLNNQQLFYSQQQQQQQQAVIGGMIPNPFFATPTQQNASSFLLQQQLSNLNLNASAAGSASQSKASTTANTNNVWH